MVKKQRPDSEKQLSALENEILEILWKNSKGRSREIYIILKSKRELAHSTVAVMLDRLHQKGCVTREIESCRGGFRYIYYPSYNREEFEKLRVQRAVDKIIEKFGATAINYFDEKFGRKR